MNDCSRRTTYTAAGAGSQDELVEFGNTVALLVVELFSVVIGVQTPIACQSVGGAVGRRGRIQVDTRMCGPSSFLAPTCCRPEFVLGSDLLLAGLSSAFEDGLTHGKHSFD